METLADLGAAVREPDPAKVRADLAGFLKRRGMSDEAEIERVVQAAFDARAKLSKRYQDVSVLYSLVERLREAAEKPAKPR
jgi:hypothetical protein